MHRVHLFDPQLLGSGGHYLNHDAQLVRELRRRNMAVSLYGRRGCQVTCEGVMPTPLFSSDIFQEAATDAQVWAIENFHNVNQSFLVDLCQLSAEQFSADDLVYFPNLLQNQLYAVAMWLARLPTGRRPAVAVMLRYLNHAMDYVQTRANKDFIALYYRYAAQALAKVQPRSTLCADTRELAEAYRKITGLPVLELPNPMDVSSLVAPAQERALHDRPVIVYQGHTSPLRGFHFLPEIIERCARLQPRPRFVVQVQNRNTAPAMQLGPTLERLDRLHGDDVRLVEGALAPTDYFDLLLGADIVLLPYSPTFYGHGSSGVFTESASLGKVIAVSPGTMPARQGREYQLGVAIAAKWTPQAMAEAVADALQRLPALRRQAESSAGRFRAENCAAAFWDRLLAAVRPPPSPAPALAAQA